MGVDCSLAQGLGLPAEVLSPGGIIGVRAGDVSETDKAAMVHVSCCRHLFMPSKSGAIC